MGGECDHTPRPHGFEGARADPPRGLAAANSGFTLIEALMALLVLALVFGVAATSLVGLLRSERAIALGEEAALVASELQAELYLHATFTNTAARRGDRWWVAPAEVEVPSAPLRGFRWRLWEIVPRDRPSAAFRFWQLIPAESE